MTQFKHKKWGDIVTVEDGKVIDMPARFLTDEWEEYEEPKEYWYLDNLGGVFQDPADDDWVGKRREQVGNYFSSPEEAEKAVEKLKAFANLRKRGFKFNGWTDADRGIVGEFEIYCDALEIDGIEQELEICFGGEDE